MPIKPKKSLGQNFLFDKNIQHKIIRHCNFHPQDIVLEIGAGRGELTRLIADKVSAVFSLEIDSALVSVLKDNLRDYKNVKVIHQDVLSFNLKTRFKHIQNKIKVVGNIPYHITTPIIQHLFRERDKIENIFITVQKEFGRRIVASAGSKDYSAFSCFVQYYTQPEILFLIKKSCFYPRPKVDSCFLRLEIRQVPAVRVKNETLLFKIIRASFNQRRKILKNSLSGIIPQAKLNRFFARSLTDKNTRPEQLSLEDFARLANQ